MKVRMTPKILPSKLKREATFGKTYANTDKDVIKPILMENR